MAHIVVSDELEQGKVDAYCHSPFVGIQCCSGQRRNAHGRQIVCGVDKGKRIVIVESKGSWLRIEYGVDKAKRLVVVEGKGSGGITTVQVDVVGYKVGRGSLEFRGNVD